MSGKRCPWIMVVCSLSIHAHLADTVLFAEVPDGGVVGLFASLEHELDGTPFKYRLFEPDGKASKKEYPLIVWLHDHGERELANDDLGHLNYLGLFVNEPVRSNYPFYILAVACLPESDTWIETEGGSASLERVAAALEEVLQEFPVDEDRVYLAGLGTGATACWELARQQPERFAALLSIAPSANNSPSLHEITHLPTWVMHWKDADGLSIANEQVSHLKQHGGVASLTELDGETERTWTPVFEEFNLVEWLLAQQRGSYCWNRPGSRPWQWWEALLQFGVPVLVVAACFLEWRRHKARSA